MESIKDLGNGFFEIKGVKLSLDQLMALGAKQVKSEDEMIDRAISQEFSRAKTKHFVMEYTRIVQANAELMRQVKPFDQEPEDFRAIAELKVKKSR
jgi:inorganic pyrophosphatase/exopolyphosphatase